VIWDENIITEDKH